MSGRTAKQEQEQISPNHVPTIFHFSVDLDTTRGSQRDSVFALLLIFCSKTLNQNSEQNFLHFRLASRFRRREREKKMKAEGDRRDFLAAEKIQMRSYFEKNSKCSQ